MKAPLVQFRGQWVHVNAQEIQAALDFWRKKGAGQMTAREAVQMALGARRIRRHRSSSPASRPKAGWRSDSDNWKAARHSKRSLPPEGLHATLRPYQVRGYSWLAFVKRWGFGACLADDMGLGKTIQTLSLIQRDRAAGADRPGAAALPDVGRRKLAEGSGAIHARICP